MNNKPHINIGVIGHNPEKISKLLAALAAYFPVETHSISPIVTLPHSDIPRHETHPIPYLFIETTREPEYTDIALSIKPMALDFKKYMKESQEIQSEPTQSKPFYAALYKQNKQDQYKKKK